MDIRNKICQLLAIGILVLMLPVGAAMADVELVENGGFETGDLTGWEPYEEVNPFLSTVESGAAAHSGTYGLRLKPGNQLAWNVSSVPVQAISALTLWGGNPLSFEEWFLTSIGICWELQIWVMILYADFTFEGPLQYPLALPLESEIPPIWTSYSIPVSTTKLISLIMFIAAPQPSPLAGVPFGPCDGCLPPDLYLDDVSLLGPDPIPTPMPFWSLNAPFVVALALIAGASSVALKRSRPR